MNRKQRRAASKQSPLPGPGMRLPPAADPVKQLFAEAAQYQQNNELAAAARLYKRLLLLKPDHAEASNNLGVVLLAQGKLSEASARFAQSLALMPQLFDQFTAICATLVALLPPLGEAMRQATAAWPNRLPVGQLLGSAGLAAIAADPLLLFTLQSTPMRDVAIERALTALRLSLLNGALAGHQVDDTVLAFCCALAQQCFINEYVFATVPAEDAQVDQLKAALGDALAAGSAIAPMALAALAMYRPLHALSDAQALLDRTWPPAVDDVLTQQLREPLQERELRAAIPRLTPIEDDVSQRVRQQYEENPYPRWVHAATANVVLTIDEHLRRQFPSAPFRALGKDGETDILVAGCGTGRHPIEVARTYKDARVLAVDLSLSSLCYAGRKTPAEIADRIDYAQADILKLGSIGRTFDLIDASGVLHHMADPLGAWRTLLALLRPNGFMHLGLYSEIARRDVVAARAFIAEHGYRPTADDIRRCRQDLLSSPLNRIARVGDFFSTSECRDLLFHVQERRMTVPEIKSFIVEQNLQFIGFEFSPQTLQRYRALFADSGWSPTDLDRWHALETQYPDTFSGMYQFWVQKN
ncbi:MAG: class I SAM-dependent methyltransferase [Rhizobiales bacterium]|nr:class I SAM-dependent methyltransferase [Hyphomicrobiales bacterium]